MNKTEYNSQVIRTALAATANKYQYSTDDMHVIYENVFNGNLNYITSLNDSRKNISKVGLDGMALELLRGTIIVQGVNSYEDWAVQLNQIDLVIMNAIRNNNPNQFSNLLDLVITDKEVRSYLINNYIDKYMYGQTYATRVDNPEVLNGPCKQALDLVEQTMNLRDFNRKNSNYYNNSGSGYGGR